MSSNQIRVLIADEQPLARAGLRSVLTSAPRIAVVGEATDGEEAVAEARRLRPDVVLMDVVLPRLDGIEATRRIRAGKVLMTSTFPDDGQIVEALRAGAAGFLLKDCPVAELIAAVRAVAAGQAQLSPAVTRRLLDQVAHRLPAPVTTGTAGLEHLTPRERETLQLIAGGLTNAEIAGALVVSEPTVKTHVSAVLSKLGLRSRIQAVIYAYEVGVARA